MAVTFELHPRESKSEQCWIFVNGELVEKCATVVKVERLAACVSDGGGSRRRERAHAQGAGQASPHGEDDW